MFNKIHLKILFILSILLLPISQVFAVAVLPEITRIVTIQPIIVSDNNGDNTATFLGSASQQALKGLLMVFGGRPVLMLIFLVLICGIIHLQMKER